VSKGSITAYISRSNLLHNAALLSGQCRESVRFCPAVKADAYGHDAQLVTSALAEQADAYAVVTIEEAEQIRPVAAGKPILAMRPLFAGVDSELIELARERGFHCTICSISALRYVQSALKPGTSRLNVHLKVDSGMGRAGCLPEQAQALVEAVDQSDQLQLTGVYTHFATADEPDLSFAHQQLSLFERFMVDSGLMQRGGIIRHACNSTATLRLGQAHYDMVRPGIAVYGYLCEHLQGKYDLHPVLRLEAPLVQVKTISPGQSCGYGRTFVASHQMRIGLVPVGYADVVLRRLSNGGVMLIGDREVPIIGRVSMDQTIVDLTNVASASEGTTVTVVDNRQDSPCNAQAIANATGTIPYEVLTGIGNRVKRVLVD